MLPAIVPISTGKRLRIRELKLLELKIEIYSYLEKPPILIG